MRKFSKSKKAAILATVMGGWLIGGSALASNNLFITVPSNYGNSNLSVITGSRVTSQVDKQAIIGAVDNLNRDPGTYAFVMDGKNMFVMRQYTYSTTDLLPFRVIDADADWSNLQYASGTVSQGANPHSAAGANGYVYTGDYDLGTITVSKLSKDSLTEEVEKTVYLLKDINDYCGGNLITGLEEKNAWVHGEGININGDNLYIMVSVNPIGGYTPYDDSYLMHYKILPDGSLKFTSYTRAVRNNDTIKLNRYNNQLMGTGIGGYQSYDSANPETGITIASIGTNGYLNPSSSKKVILPESVINDGLEFHDMNIWPDGTAYIMAYSLTGSGSNSQLKIYKTTVANLNSDNPEEWETVVADNPDATGTSGVPSGWINRFFTEYYTKRLWGEIGNYLVVYTDGDKKPALVWDSYGLAGNDSYHTFNSTSLLEGDSVYGDQAVLTSAREEGLTSPSVTTKKITNLNANLKTGDYTQRITGTDKDVLYNSVTTDNSNYIFDTDKVIDLRSNSWATQTDLKNNILAAVYAKEGNDINIDAGNNTLQLQTSNIIATPVGVYAGNGKNVTINAGKLNVITVGVEGGNSLTNAIMNDGGLDKANKITINGDVNINMRGGWGGNGVAVQKTSRWGEASYASNVENSITINGNLSIKGADNEKWGIPLNSDNVLSRFNNAGILTQVNNSRVDVTGLVDMDVYGNGITANAVNSTISIGGGTITVPKGMNYSYYTLGAYQGTINVNTGKDGKEAGTNDVKLNGDVFALNTGKINLALTTADSYLQGMVDNGGTVNMWLQNGASWYNQENNTRYEQDNEDIGSKDKSHINKFIGGSKGSEGVIYQKLNSKDIVIDNYSGNAIVIYEHDSSTPTSIYGGNITVGSASAGSGIILRTDSSGIDLTSAEKTDKVLDSLANKLYYTNYTVGEKNLDGEVQIAEGLTASSVSKRVGSVAYDETTGQGRLDKAESKPDIPKPDIPNGDNTNDGENISVNGEKWIGNNSGDNVSVTVNNNGEWQGDNSGNKLTVTGKNSVWNGSNNGSNMQLNGDNFTWNGDNNGTAATVKMKNGSTWTGSNTANDLNAVFDNSNWNGENKGENATVELKNDSSWEKDSNGSGLKLTIDDSSYKGNVNGSNSIVNIVNDGNWTGDSKGINNKVDIETGTWTGDNNGDGAVISLGGTAVKSRTLGKAVWNGSNNAANSTVTLSNNSVWNGDNTGDKASITINGSTWNGSNEAVDADINLSNGSSWSKDNSGKNAEISLTESEWTGNSSGEGLKLTADKSEWTGNALAEGNAELKNGAVWKGSSSTDKFNLTLKESTWKNTGESKLGSLSANNGIVDMTESGSGNVTIGKYSGSTTVIYSHEEKDPTKVNGGNFTIGSAESGSKITLQTDNKGVDTTDEDSINEALNALANKLYYTGYVTGEKNLSGYVKIAEGLTAASVQKQVGDIKYDSATGQGSLDKGTVKPGPTYPTEQEKEEFVTAITGDYETDKEYRKGGVLTEDNNIYKFKKEETKIKTESDSVRTEKDTTLELNKKNLTIKAENGNAIAVKGGKLTVKEAGKLTLEGKKAITAENSKAEITGESVKANGAVETQGENSSISITTTGSTTAGEIYAKGNKSSIKINAGGKAEVGNLKAEGSASEVSVSASEVSVNGEIDVKGTGSKATVKNISKLSGNVTTESEARAELMFKEGAEWTGDNNGNTTVSMTKGSWNGNNTGKLNAALNSGTKWTGDNSGKNAEISLTESEWTGNSSGEGLKLTADKSEWTGNALAEGNAELKNGAVWKGSSSTDKFNLTLKESTWKNTGESKLGSLSANNGIVDMTESGSGNVTIGKYSGSTTVIYSHEEKDPTKVNGGNFTIGSAESGSKITLQTDNKGVDTTDEDSINEALNALANKLYYTGYVTGEKNLSGYVKIAEGLTAASVQKQVGDIKYDSATGQGSLKEGSVTPGVTYPEAQTKVTFTSQITGDWSQDKEYKLAGVLHTDNAVYNFQKDSTTITVDEVAVGADRYLQLQINNKDLTLNSGADAVKASGIDININDVRNLNIKADGKTLLAENGGRIIINNSGLVTANSAVKAEGTGSVVEVKGLADINTSGGTAIEAADGSVKIGGGTINGDIYASGQGSVKINTSGSESGNNATKLNGDITASNDADISLGLSGKDSSFNGNVISEDKAVVNIYAKDKASWTGKADGDGINLTLLDSAKWNNTGDSKLNSLSADKGIIDQTGESAGNITVDNYSGSVTVLYKHSLTENTDGSISDIQFHGGNFTVKQAEQGSSITLRTDRSGINSFAETENVEKLFNEMAKKLFYLDAENKPDNLVGRLELSEGLTATSATKVYGDIEYSADGQGSYKEDSLIRTDPDITYGSSETAMMRGAKSAMASTALLWRSENNDMLQRIGDVRLNSEESGLWAKYYGGKTSYDANNTKYSTSFNAYQLGYDKKLNDNVLFGTAVSYNKGSNTYEMGGHGDSKNIALSVYSSWNGNKGHYADVVVKGGKLNNDYKVYNDMGHKLEGDYDTWGVALSAEYGRRMQLSSGFWFDPSVQFTLGRINGTDYSAESDFLDSKGKNKYMYVSQDAFTSAIGRIGLGIGKTAEKGMFYTKLALAHEFSGDFTTTFAADGEPTSGTRVDFSGSWLEWQLGGNMKLNDNSYVYATFEKKFGGDTGSSDWRLDAGLRWSF